jgi:hypothetical protein
LIFTGASDAQIRELADKASQLCIRIAFEIDSLVRFFQWCRLADLVCGFNDLRQRLLLGLPILALCRGGD